MSEEVPQEARSPTAPSSPSAQGRVAGQRLGFLALVVILVGACMGGAVVTALYGVFFHEESAPPPVQTVVRTGPSVVTAMRDLARLESASYHVERVIDLRDKQTRLFGLVQGEDSLLLVAAGDIVAGVDLTTMRTGDVVIDERERSVTVVLPPPIVLSAKLDNERTYVHSRSTDMLAQRAESLETRARQEAERTLRDAALKSGILERAQKNAAHTIEALVRSLGYTSVDVQFRKE